MHSTQLVPQKGATMSLFTILMEDPASFSLNYRIALWSKCVDAKNRTLTNYCEVVNYLLETYVPADATLTVDAKILRCTVPLKILPLSCVRAHWKKSLRSSDVYTEYVCKDIFIEGLHRSIPSNIQEYWRAKKNSSP